MTIRFDKDLDARGLNCPLPILRAKKALNDMSSGQILRIVTTDPGSVRDFNAFALQTGNELISSTETSTETGNQEFEFHLVRK
ncbi:SirA family protein [Sterolibacterium denitrificans]|uniref:SirA family protein n=1 Tax=Sterolibacterium denitrificans TaxID=157592 RepID=A0A7Z7HSH2_9PROT|nr:SirA family protein [Sterolibacterium denitrificans]